MEVLINFTTNSSSSPYNYTTIEEDDILFCPTEIREEFPGVLVDLIFAGIGIPIFTLFGLFGNALSIIVLSRKNLRLSDSSSSINILLISLAVVDSIFILTTTLFQSLAFLFQFLDILPLYQCYIHHVGGPFLFPIAITFQTASIYFTLAITVERFIAIHFPLDVKRICTRRRTILASLGIIAFAVAFNAPRWFELGTNRIYSKKDPLRVTRYAIAPNQFPFNPYWKALYYLWGYFIVFNLLPLLILVPLNLCIFCKIRQGARTRSTLTSKTSPERDNSTNLTLLAIIIVFVVCSVPRCALAVTTTLFDTVPIDLATISNFLLIVNSSTNFLVYVAFSGKFRLQLRLMRHEPYFGLCPCTPSARETQRRRSSSSVIPISMVNVHRNSS